MTVQYFCLVLGFFNPTHKPSLFSFFCLPVVCLVSCCGLSKDRSQGWKQKTKYRFKKILTFLFPVLCFRVLVTKTLNQMLMWKISYIAVKNTNKLHISLNHDFTQGAAILDFNKLYEHGYENNVSFFLLLSCQKLIIIKNI